MIERHYVSFRAGSGEAGRHRMHSLLREAGCPELMPTRALSLFDKQNWLFGEMLNADDPRLIGLLSSVQKAGIKVTRRVERIYSAAELRSFPLLILTVTRAAIDGGDPGHGTIYDVSMGCVKCAAGARQVSPLHASESGLKKKTSLCVTHDGHVLVDLDVADALGTAGLSGLELRQVQSYRNNPMPWWQVLSSYTMPKMSAHSQGIITDEVDTVMDDGMVIRALPPCSVCRRDGRYGTTDEPMHLFYNRSGDVADALPDIVHTWECFGKSGWDPAKPETSRVAPPLMLVKPRVFDIFRGLKIKQAHFSPVEFI